MEETLRQLGNAMFAILLVILPIGIIAVSLALLVKKIAEKIFKK